MADEWHSPIASQVDQNKIAAENFAESFVTDLTSQAALTQKVKGKSLLLDTLSTKPQPQPKRKPKRKTLSRKARKEMKLDEITDTRYSTFEPLHELWKGYMAEVMQDQSDLPTKLLKCDYHGAIITVVESKVPTNIHTTGIVVKDTENMFYVITRDNLLKSTIFLMLEIPKQNHIFRVEFTNAIIYGNFFRVRPQDRASRKFKPKPSIEL
ncbi:RNase P/RNase MRP complex subunit [Boothiomyces sp. JEL0866]|nr:RNase P/RNase MRP complex subunit [Boothiomyces sp. JEL0866]